MSWALLESATENDAFLELYGKDGTFMIRANGRELMNGYCHDSEVALGNAAARLAPGDQPRVLVGGLGLGYTAAAVRTSLQGRGTITVAELSSAVIDWFHRYTAQSLLSDPDQSDPDAGIEIVHANIADLMTVADRYDVVVMDVDNGPEPLVTATNAALYSSHGLSMLHACLSPNGVALIWSGFESPAFATRAKEAGFTVACEQFQRERAELAHFIYVLRKGRVD